MFRKPSAIERAVFHRANFEPCSGRAENKSPGVISMGSANIERISISPKQVQAGTYTTERPLTGIQRGAFTIVGTVTTDGN